MKGNIKNAEIALKEEETTGYENNPQVSIEEIEKLELEEKTQGELELLSKRVYELQGEAQEKGEISFKRYYAQKRRISNFLD